MDVPVILRDGVDAEEAVLAAVPHPRRAAAAQTVAVDAAVDHHMGDVNAGGAVFASHALRDHAQPSLGGREMRKSRLAADAGGGAGEYDGAAAERAEAA